MSASSDSAAASFGCELGPWLALGRAVLAVACGLATVSATARGEAPSAPPAERSFTPEEQTNIAVYEAGNRSVVTIHTKATVAADFFMIEVP
ncbi:MAG: hypothetical protein ACKO1M_05925 [Planctomycetota bacterium]